MEGILAPGMLSPRPRVPSAGSPRLALLYPRRFPPPRLQPVPVPHTRAHRGKERREKRVEDGQALLWIFYAGSATFLVLYSSNPPQIPGSHKQDRLPFPWLSLGEFSLAVYCASGLFLAWQQGVIWSNPYLFLYATGFGAVVCVSFWEISRQWRSVTATSVQG